jgi:hypothetical protein
MGTQQRDAASAKAWARAGEGPFWHFRHPIEEMRVGAELVRWPKY